MSQLQFDPKTRYKSVPESEDGEQRLPSRPTQQGLQQVGNNSPLRSRGMVNLPGDDGGKHLFNFEGSGKCYVGDCLLRRGSCSSLCRPLPFLFDLFALLCFALLCFALLCFACFHASMLLACLPDLGKLSHRNDDLSLFNVIQILIISPSPKQSQGRPRHPSYATSAPPRNRPRQSWLSKAASSSSSSA